MNSDKETIKAHYEKSKRITISERKHLKTFNIRQFNNFIKALLIKENIKRKDTVLDIGCGKGGDLKKFLDIGIKELYGIDFCESSIEEANSRLIKIKPPFKCTYEVQDSFNKEFNLGRQFDVISLQFSFHYAFLDLETLRTSLRNISEHLRMKGRVIITIPNSETLLRRHKQYGLTYGNKFYQVKFLEEPKANTLGVKYLFSLKDAIEDCVEYLVDIDIIKREASSFNLKIVECKDFISYFNDNVKNHLILYNTFLNCKMSEEELSVPRLYSILILEKY